MSTRLGVKKTYKLYIGGKFPRSESGRSLPARNGSQLLDNYCHASRKDFRDAVVAARKAQPGWQKATAYLRGQILYRAAEMLEHRAPEMVAEIIRSTGVKQAQAEREVQAAVDRLVHCAGWTDKFTQLFGSVNPVSSPHFNFTTPEPTGVVTLLCPPSPSLLGLVSLVAPAILTGNTVIALASETTPLPAITFAEILATSDLPGGVINILTGPHAEIVSHAADHMDVNAIVDATGSTVAQAGTAVNLKRYAARSLSAADWFSTRAADPLWILDTVEMKTAWHPVGL